MKAPGTLDGGDALRVEKTIYVGRTRRTNGAGIAQLKAFLSPYGYRVAAVEVAGCLHLKSACTYLGGGTLLVNGSWIDPAPFRSLKLLKVDPAEPFAANALQVAGRLLFPSCFPRTRDKIAKGGFQVLEVDNSELMKAESALTCMSVIFSQLRPAGLDAP